MKLFSKLFLALVLTTSTSQSKPDNSNCDFNLAPCDTQYCSSATIATSCNGVNCPIISEKLHNRTDPQAQLARSILAGHQRGIEEAIEQGANPYDLGDYREMIEHQLSKELESAKKKAAFFSIAGIYGLLTGYYDIYKLGSEAFATAKTGYSTGFSPEFYNSGYSLLKTTAQTTFALTATYLLAFKLKEYKFGLFNSKTRFNLALAYGYSKTLQKLRK